MFHLCIRVGPVVHSLSTYLIPVSWLPWQVSQDWVGGRPHQSKFCAEDSILWGGGQSSEQRLGHTLAEFWTGLVWFLDNPAKNKSLRLFLWLCLFPQLGNSSLLKWGKCFNKVKTWHSDTGKKMEREEEGMGEKGKRGWKRIKRCYTHVPTTYNVCNRMYWKHAIKK